jgi:peptidyl-tRNA hydrolase, PTH1 family
MKIIAGLGNPGEKYQGTRHNVGFMFVDMFKDFYEFPDFLTKEKFFGEISEKTFLNEQKILLIKPHTFMNNSGRAIGSLMHYYKIEPQDLIIVHDDLDMEIGHYKISRDVRAAGHNGVQDIIDHIGSQDFTRMRIGVETSGGRQERGVISGKDFVLQQFNSKEREIAQETIDEIIKSFQWS